MEAAFEFLFKYRPLVFEKGRLVLAAPWPVVVVAAVAIAVAVPALWSYTRARAKSRPRDRAVLAALRLGVLLVLLLCLLRPTLVVATVVPQQSFVGVLIDDSRSMSIADQAGEPRSAAVGRLFGDGEGGLRRALEARFKLRLFRFSASAERLGRISDLTYAGARSDLAAALTHARQEMQGVPLSGLVVVSDGADNGKGGLTEALLQLKAAGVAVHTVGVGSERFPRDVEVSRVEAPRTVLQGTSLLASLTVAQRGLAGERARLVVEDGDRVVHAREITLPSHGEPAVVRAHVVADQPGPRILRFRVAPLEGETLARNNEQQVLVDVLDRREKILYYEGEARFEPKFLRRAVSDDRNLQLVTLERTAKKKYLRLDVDDADELAGGFPASREELFRYRGLMLGSVEASAFAADQLRMIVDFVSVRGGGLLMLGGGSSFAEGGYAGTPLAEALPVTLEPPAAGAEPYFAELKVEPTPFGLTHAVTQLAASEEESEQRWRKLPPLSARNAVRRTRPGAATLLLGRPEGGDPQVVLAYQRYGRGRSLALAVQDTWLWQMHADIPLEDRTHENLWRQLLRWLVADVPGPVVLTRPEGPVAPGSSVVLRAEVADERYLHVNDARVVATVSDPSGEKRDLPMEWTVAKDGEYRASFVAADPGVYQVSVLARRGGATLGSDRVHLQVADLPVEFQGAEMRAGLLRRVAEETGGRFYAADAASSLPEDLAMTGGGSTVSEAKDLWDMPAVYLLAVALVSTEWAYRRARGLA